MVSSYFIRVYKFKLLALAFLYLINRHVICLLPIGVTVGFSSIKYHANEGETVDIEVVLTGAHAVDVAVDIQVAPSAGGTCICLRVHVEE